MIIFRSALISAGATHLVLAPVPPWPARPAAWLAEEIVAPVQAEWRAGIRIMETARRELTS